MDCAAALLNSQRRRRLLHPSSLPPHQPSAASHRHHEPSLSLVFCLWPILGGGCASGRVVAMWLVEGTQVRRTVTYLSICAHLLFFLSPSNIMSAVTATHGALLSCSVPVVPLHTSDHRGVEVHGEDRAPLRKFGCFESATQQGNFFLLRSSLMELGWNGFVGVLGVVQLYWHLNVKNKI